MGTKADECYLNSGDVSKIISETTSNVIVQTITDQGSSPFSLSAIQNSH